MSKIKLFKPKSVDDVMDIVSRAGENKTGLDIQGAGSKRTFGAPRYGVDILDMSAFEAVIDYEPGEMVITVGAGAGLKDIAKLVDGENQMFAFDPMDLGAILGQAPGQTTIGGMVASGIAGSGRLSRGSVRDHVLGFEAVSGRGERFIAGGKVVKNVTGFDICKLFTGSWGRLGAMTQVTLKLVPKPETTCTVWLEGLEPDMAQQALSSAMKLSIGIATATYYPKSTQNSVSKTAFRLEGFSPAVETGCKVLAVQLTDFGKLHVASTAEAKTLRSAVQALSPFKDADVLWRINTPPSAGPSIAKFLNTENAEWVWDWAGGLTWTSFNGSSESLRKLAILAGGHATLVGAPEAMRKSIPIFQPQSSAVTALEDRVRKSFDPLGVYETGRFPVISEAQI